MYRFMKVLARSIFCIFRKFTKNFSKQFLTRYVLTFSRNVVLADHATQNHHSVPVSHLHKLLKGQVGSCSTFMKK